MKTRISAMLLLVPGLLAAQAEVRKLRETPNPGPECQLPLDSEFLQQHRAALAATGGYESVSGTFLKVSQTHFTTPYDSDICLCLKPESAD